MKTMPEKESRPPLQETMKVLERQINIEKTHELAGRAHGALVQVAGNLDGIKGMEQLRVIAIELAKEVETRLLVKIK